MALAARALRAGFRLHAFDTIGSTNAEALARAAAGDHGRLWLTAAVQTAGRGRLGRHWSSPTGNLHASLLLVGAGPEAVSPQLGLVAAVALFDAVAGLTGAHAGWAIKWPNDLLHAGAKVAGILLEGTRTPSGRPAIVLGIGVNVATHPDELPYPATSLAAVTGRPVAPDLLFEALSGTMMDALDVWRHGAGFDEIRAGWLARAHPLGAIISVSRDGDRLSGTFGGLDREGRLLLRTDDDILTIGAGDILLHDTRPRAADLVDT